MELPSQFMENFCWEWEVISRITSHVETGEAMPRESFERLLAARAHLRGIELLRRTLDSLFDMRLYHELAVPGAEVTQAQVDELVRQAAAQASVVERPSWWRPLTTFTHIFGGGYEAAYYSYLWSEVISTDAFGVFAESGRGTVLDPEIGARFWREVLAVGASRPALESFVAFRGRPPSSDALFGQFAPL